MIVNDDFPASWDQPTRSLLLHNVQPTRLQALATQYAEKLQVCHWLRVQYRAAACWHGLCFLKKLG